MKKIIVIHKGELTSMPPIISVILNLIDLKYPVTLIDTGVDEQWKIRLSKEGVLIYVAPQEKRSDKIQKLQGYFSFRKYVNTILRNIVSDCQNTILWVLGAGTIMALGKSLCRYRFILNIEELSDTSKIRLKAISRVINQAELVIMPEYNRAILYKFWFNLKEVPTVLPNKPYFFPTKQEMALLRAKYKKELDIIAGRRVILYQGIISEDRDLTNYIKAVKSLGDNYVFVMIGSDWGALSKYLSIDKNILYFGFLPAPEYLFFTSIAYIGIVTYDLISLNNAYCAPNKIWEYAKYGVPMIGNDIPGLRYSIFQAKAGTSVDENDEASISSGINLISNNYEDFSSNAKIFFDNQDNISVIKEALNKLS